MKHYIKCEQVPVTFSLKKLYSVVIGLLPVIMIYNVPFIGKGASTIFLGLFAPYVLIKFFSKSPRLQWKTLLPFGIYIFYILLRNFGNFENMFLMAIVACHVMGATQDTVDIDILRKTIECVALAAAVVVVIQTGFYYIVHIKMDFIIKPLVLKDLQYYFTKTGSSLYRPSAFFLEPSHLAQYSCVAIASILLPKGGMKNVKLHFAAVIAIGTTLTTSGIGINLCVGVFAWYIICKAFSKDFVRGIIIICIGIIAIGIGFALMIKIDIFALSLQRVFGEVDGYNAIWGRTLFWDSTIGVMSGKDLFIGYGTFNTVENYMTGLMENIYCYGYLGLGLLMFVVIANFLNAKTNRFPQTLCIIYIALLFVANQSGFINLIFWFVIIVSCICKKTEETEEYVWSQAREKRLV